MTLKCILRSRILFVGILILWQSSFLPGRSENRNWYQRPGLKKGVKKGQDSENWTACTPPPRISRRTPPGMLAPTDMFQWINCGSTVKRIVYFKWVFQFKNIMLNHFSTGPPIITDHTLQASEISESEAKLTVCTTSSVYCIAHTGRIISTSLADKTNKD